MAVQGTRCSPRAWLLPWLLSWLLQAVRTTVSLTCFVDVFIWEMCSVCTETATHDEASSGLCKHDDTAEQLLGKLLPLI